MWRNGGRSRWRGWGAWAAWGLAVSPLVIFGLVPLVVLAAKAASEGSTETLVSAATWSLLGRSLALSAVVAGLAGVIGCVAGYALAATRWPGRSLTHVLLIAPLVLPPYVHAIGWTTLLRPGGPAVGTLATILGVTPATIADGVYSFGGAALVLSLALFPVPMLFVHASLASTPHSLVEAAQGMGAGPWRVFLTARWPFILPAALSSTLIVFLLASADLGVPTILKVPVFNFEVFTQLGAFNDVSAATMLAAPLVAAGLLAVAFERRLVAGRFYQSGDRETSVGRPDSAWAKSGAITCTLGLIALGLVLPLGAVIAQGWNLDALGRAASIAVRPALHTLIYSGMAAVCVALLAVALSWLGRGMGTGGAGDRTIARITDGLLVLGFATPGAILALGLLATYDRPAVSRVLPAGTLVVAALVVRLVIIGQRITEAGVLAIPDSYIEAAQLCGANSPRIARSIVLPLIAPHVAGAAAAAFVLATADISSTILLYPPGGETLPIALYGVEANSPRSLTAAMTVMVAFVSVVPALALLLVQRVWRFHID